MPVQVRQEKLAFVGDCAKGFILGSIRSSFSTEIGIASLKERVLAQWGGKGVSSAELVDELMEAILWLAEQKYITIKGEYPMMERNYVRLFGT